MRFDLHQPYIARTQLIVALCLAFSLAVGCIKTAECDKNNPCNTGELCFRSFCHKTCDGPTEAHFEACGVTDPNSDIICRSCDGECAGAEGYVCVHSTICEPICSCAEGENCCVNGSCVQ